MAETIRLPVTVAEVMNFTHEQRVELAETVAGLLAAAEIDGLTAVELFGSVAKNYDGPQSDIDILVTHSGDPDGPESEMVKFNTIGILIYKGVPFCFPVDGKQAAAGKVSLWFEADEAFQNPMKFYG